MKKVLIVTYYWPPSGGGGVQRWLKFAKYLPEYGWEPIIYTPENPDFELKDDSLLSDVDQKLEVVKLPIWEPFKIYRKLLGKGAVRKQGVVDEGSSSRLTRLALWIRSNIFIPDPRIFWVRPSVNFLSKYLTDNPVDVLITTGPPHSMHLIGLEVKKRIGLKWVADFRDPWSKWDLLRLLNLNKRAWRAHKKLENKVLTNADLVVTVSERLAESLTGLGAKASKVVMNGYDVADFSRIQQKPDKFRITHLGLLNQGRNPEYLWQSLNELCVEVDGFRDNLEVVLAGTIEESVIKYIQGFTDLSNCLQIKEYVPHKEVSDTYAGSSILLLLINQTDNASWILPGKLFEYLVARRPILAFGPTDSDANDVLKASGTGQVVSYQDKQTIKNWVSEQYEAFQSGKKIVADVSIEPYSRTALAQELAVCLNQLQ